MLKLITPECLASELRSSQRQCHDRRQCRGGSDARFLGQRHEGTPILIAFLVAFFNQLSGINAILYFAPRIFELTGLGARPHCCSPSALAWRISSSPSSACGSLTASAGARCFTIGSFGYIASLGLCAWAFFTEHFTIVPVCIFAFIAAHAIGQGAVIWVLISDSTRASFRRSKRILPAPCPSR